jgi:hypothetical protein
LTELILVFTTNIGDEQQPRDTTMPTLEDADDRPTGRPAHMHSIPIDEPTEKCPWCGSKISRAEFQRIRDQIAEHERARLAEVEQNLRQQFARQQQKARATAEAQVEKSKRDAATQIETARKQAAAREATIRKQAAETATAALAPKIAVAVADAKKGWHGEKLKLTAQLESLQRKLENTHTPAHTRGEVSEVDLFQAMTAAFPEPDNRLRRVVRGQRGPDIIMEIVQNGSPAGIIIIDSKNISRWSNKFVSKIAEDARNENTDFCIIASNVLPAGEQQICIRSHVVIATPQRVVVLVHLLRRQLIENHRLKLAGPAKDEKAQRLLDYIISPTCTDLIERILKVSGELAELDRTETAAHSRMWAKRAGLIGGLQRIHDEFAGTVSAIIGEAS